ncbi:hypothetical protein D3C72_1343860 [compost metagenome]
MRERTGQGEAHLHIHPGRASALLFDQVVANLPPGGRTRARVASTAVDRAGMVGGIPLHVRRALEFRDDRPYLDAQLRFNMGLGGRRQQRRPRQAGGDFPQLPEEGPHFVAREIHGESLVQRGQRLARIDRCRTCGRGCGRGYGRGYGLWLRGTWHGTHRLRPWSD